MTQTQFTFAHRFDQVSGSAIREIFKVIAQPGMISFAGGNPSSAALPDDTVLYSGHSEETTIGTEKRRYY